MSGSRPARSCAVANRTICSCSELSFRYATPTVSARRLARFQPTAAATIDHGHHAAVRPPLSPVDRTANHAITDARAGRAPAAVTRSTGARVAGVARAGARVAVRRNGAAGQVEAALACVAS